MKVNVGNDLYLKGRIGWKGLSKSEYLDKSQYRIINGYSLKDGYVDWKIAGFISEERYEESPEIKLEINDILISKDGTIGKVGIVRKLELPSTVASGIFVLRNIIEDKLDTEYLFQFLKSSNFKNFINRVKAEGSTINHLYQRDLIRLEIDVPGIKEQKRISKILKDIDDKIEVNNKINQELEALAKTIYDYWFVQFDFPDQNGKPYKSSGGKMVYNEELKREIPAGWEVKLLGDFAEIKRGKLITEKTANLSGNVKVVSAGIDYSYLHDEANREKYTITVSGSGANAGFVNFWREPIFANDCSTVIGRNDFETFVILQFLKLRQEYILKQARGSAQPHVYPKDLAALKILIPNSDLFESYGQKVLALNEKISNNDKENQKLAALRDWLLPMLMNGQVTVGEAKAQLGMVAESRMEYEKEK